MLNCNQPHCSEGGSLPDQKFLVSSGWVLTKVGTRRLQQSLTGNRALPLLRSTKKPYCRSTVHSIAAVRQTHNNLLSLRSD